MKEFVTYQDLVQEGMETGIEEGRKYQARRMVLQVGTLRLGTPPTNAQTLLETIDDLTVLRELFDLALEVETWDELLENSPN